MPKEDFYASGTIKVKNADGVSVPFYPRTKTDCIYDYQTNESLSTVISQMEEDIETAANSGSVKVCDTDNQTIIDSVLNNASNETLIAVYDDKINEGSFKCIIDTSLLELNNDINLETGVPFANVIGNNYYIVDWGDNTSDLITSSNRKTTHTYSESGKYTLEFYSPNWSKVEMYIPTGVPTYGDSNYKANALYRWKFNHTLDEILTPFPRVKQGTNVLKSLFEGSTLRVIPSNLFDNYTDATIFYGTFMRNRRLEVLPEHLFDKCTEVTAFKWTFAESLVTTIPDLLFKYNTAVTTFEACFSNVKTASMNLYITAENVGSTSTDNYVLRTTGSIFSNGRGIANSNVYVYALENSKTYETILTYRNSLYNNGYGHFILRSYRIEDLPTDLGE